MKSCFMFGHRNTPYTILPIIEQTIVEHYKKYGTNLFYVGNRGQFDSIAATAVKNVKQQYPDICLVLVLAYHPGERSILLPEGFDGSFYPPLENIPRPYAIVRANRYMVNTADTIICYVKHPGNAQNLIEYAKKRQVRGSAIIDNIADNS